MQPQEIYALLQQRGVPYQAVQHPPAFTIEGLDALDLPHKDWVVKKLFLRDDKKRAYYLVTLPGHKAVDLKQLAARIPSRKLSFASEADLQAMLGLGRGHVTPFALLGPGAARVTMVFDQALRGGMVGVHPLHNTATVFLPCQALADLLQSWGRPVIWCDLA